MESGLAITHLYNLIYEAQGFPSPSFNWLA